MKGKKKEQKILTQNFFFNSALFPQFTVYQNNLQITVLSEYLQDSLFIYMSPQ